MTTQVNWLHLLTTITHSKHLKKRTLFLEGNTWGDGGVESHLWELRVHIIRHPKRVNLSRQKRQGEKSITYLHAVKLIALQCENKQKKTHNREQQHCTPTTTHTCAHARTNATRAHANKPTPLTLTLTRAHARTLSHTFTSYQKSAIATVTQMMMESYGD